MTRRPLATLLATAAFSAGLVLAAAPSAYACQPDSPCPSPPWCGTPLEKYLGCVRPY
jgi:hypothetical protein